ncbi:ATP-dependent helicase [Rhodobacter capsulatus]|uniref:DNA 3'-5' helicase n=1 Tax=Rhodobacter capsulatus (strain ATCC BAA-309 / NBRC 16581 / SB1003) TaxID=272942 RepID=D5ATC9_RHOCB|nr:UvrD-helicase domain-containing protein [Rhodobacter capsulatus]ADE85236.1 DNA helicase II [Rhodobacter capsulatus SB 1003]ETD01963.1 ATPase AAA [Rhodobacter capsulatus DE442]ETD77003.1 ATPase AAA [Rhodobacter capsulatus R121]ETE53962.1 ATPase AAA [Rhodobacter capsulatus Y262]MDS0926946.1 UvrD-helicase domain-containing protein [Rhodobacter capsulatus]
MSSILDDDDFGGLSLSQRAMMAARGPVGTPWLDGLNDAQRRAVEALDGPVLMLAGAGTGKTKALTARIAHLIHSGRARPNEVLAVTFTNKAAREMKDRIGRLMGQTLEGMPWLGTFHSVCVKLLRRHAELVGLRSNFTILDTDDQIRLLKQLILAANMDEKRWPARQLAGLIDSWKNRAWTPEHVRGADTAHFDNRGSELYAAYQDRLRTLNAVDFGDLLLHMVTIFQRHPDVLQQYQRWFRYILVDEYQDTNTAQYLWLRLLAQGHRNICCVGDDDQSIYGWRGAEVGNILRFEKDFPGAVVVRLEQNYRSTEHILAAASGLIAANRDRLGKTLWTADKGGEKVRLIGHWDGDEEARWIGEEIEKLYNGSHPLAKNRRNTRSKTHEQEFERRVKNQLPPMLPEIPPDTLLSDRRIFGDIHTRGLLLKQYGLEDRSSNVEALFQSFMLGEITILVRASHQMRAFEDRFLTIGLPYRVIGGPRFYERQEIRDAMAYFRLAVSPDDDLAFERVVNLPKRGLGDKAQAVIQTCARQAEAGLVMGAKAALQQGAIGGKAAGALRAFLDGIGRWHAAVLENADHVRLAETILEESGYTDMWLADKTPEAPGRLENLKELVKALESFENLQGFLEHVALIMDNDKDQSEDKVSIMTLHAAKGLEFPAVFLPGWEDGLFPSQRALDEGGLRALEEERRLAYVGITRAEEICTISFAGNRRVYGQWQSQLPSRFIDELPATRVEVLTPPGLYGGGFGAATQTGFGSLEARATKADVYNSPGWKRMESRASTPPRPKARTVTTVDSLAFGVGDRVFHVKFGYGEVIDLEGDTALIEFDKAGSKHVKAGFLKPAVGLDDVPF